MRLIGLPLLRYRRLPSHYATNTIVTTCLSLILRLSNINVTYRCHGAIADETWLKVEWETLALAVAGHCY